MPDNVAFVSRACSFAFNFHSRRSAPVFNTDVADLDVDVFCWSMRSHGSEDMSVPSFEDSNLLCFIILTVLVQLGHL